MLRLPPGFRLVDFEAIDSTNDEARRRAGEALDGTVYRTQEQLSGRGRRGRVWRSPVGNLYMSVFLKPQCPPNKAAQLSFVSALAIADGISSHLPPLSEVGLKWPNDVLLNGSKVSGILLESSGVSGTDLDWLVIGIGLNILHFPTDAAYPATSLAAEGTGTIERDDLTVALLKHFKLWQDIWRSDGFGAIRQAWLARASNLGKEIEVRLAAETFEAVFEDLDEDGALVARLPDGSVRRISAGDIFPATRQALASQ